MRKLAHCTRSAVFFFATALVAFGSLLPVPASAAPARLWYDTINVLACNLSGVVRYNVAEEEYSKDVLPNEWPSWWDQPSLKSGAVAVRTWGQHSGNHYTIWDSATGQWVDGVTECGQVYVFGSRTTPTNSAVDATYQIVMTYAGSPINAQYRGEPLRGHWTDHWADDGYAYLFSVGDPVSDVTFSPWSQGRLPNGLQESCPGGVCPGESQNGSHQWEQGSYSWNEWQILSHYYTAVNFFNGNSSGLRWVDQTTTLPQNCDTCTPYYDQNTYPTVNGVPGWYVGQPVSPGTIMRVQNTGTIDYCNTGSNPIRLGYHWEGPSPIYDNGSRINVGQPPSFYGDPADGCLRPGRYAPVTTPFGVQGVMGIYTLKWDLVREYDRWFSYDGWPTKNIEFNAYDGFDYPWASRDPGEWPDVVSTGGTINTSASMLVTSLTVANSQPVYARQTLSSFDTGRNLDIQARFYDDGLNPKGAVFGTWSNDTIFRLAAGVGSWITTQNYVYRVNGNWYDSGKPRTADWHTLTMHIRPTGSWMDIDGQNSSPTTGQLTPSTIWKIGPLMNWNQVPATAWWDSIGYRYVP